MPDEFDHVPDRRRFGWYRPKPKGAMDMHIVARPLDEENWDEFRHYTRVVEQVRPFMIDYLALSADFEAVAGVEMEIGVSLTGLLAEGMISILAGVDANAQAQRRVTNFLSATSAFRDRATSRISRHFGNGSAETNAIKARMSQLYDNSFAYRCIYALRNYAQHHELPVSLAPINADRTVGGQMLARISMRLRPSTLAESSRVNGKVRSELRSLPDDDLELSPLLSEFMASHKALMLDILGFYRSRLLEMAHYAAAVYRMFEIPHDAVPVVWEGDDPAGGPATQTRSLMCGFDEMLRALQLAEDLDAELKLG